MKLEDKLKEHKRRIIDKDKIKQEYLQKRLDGMQEYRYSKQLEQNNKELKPKNQDEKVAISQYKAMCNKIKKNKTDKYRILSGDEIKQLLRYL